MQRFAGTGTQSRQVRTQSPCSAGHHACACLGPPTVGIQYESICCSCKTVSIPQRPPAETFAEWKAKFDAEQVGAGRCRRSCCRCRCCCFRGCRRRRRCRCWGPTPLHILTQLTLWHPTLEQALERAKLDGGKGEDKSGRPNGKQWFLQQEAAHIEVGA